MMNEPLRVALSTGVALALLVALVAPGCGGSESHKIAGQPDASIGDAGQGGTAAGRGGSGGSGGSAPTAGRSGAAGGSTGAGAGGQVSGGGNSGVAGEAGSGAAAAGAGGDPGDFAPDIDAGTGCLTPEGEAALSPASAGLPANGLALWLRADRGVYMTAAHRVCAWADQSGRETIFAPAGDATRPLWVPASVGAAAAIHFDAPGRYLATGGVLRIASTSARTLVTVVKLVSTTDRCSALQQGESGSPGTYIMPDANTYNTVGGREGVYVMNNAYDAAITTSATARVHVYTLNTMTPDTPIAGAIDYRVNGATQALTRTPGGLGNGNFEDFSVANYTAVGGCTDAFIAEALVYDRALGTAERAAVETALEARYGIQ